MISLLSEVLKHNHNHFPSDIPAQECRYLRHKSKHFTLHQGVLHRKLKNGHLALVLSSTQVPAALDWAHSAQGPGHFGLSKCLHKLLGHYWWPTMYSDLQLHLQKCPQCQVHRPYKAATSLGTLLTSGPFDILEVDFVGSLAPTPQQHLYIFTVTDVHTRWLASFLVHHLTAEVVIGMLRTHILPRFGPPRTLLRDRVACFGAAVLLSFFLKYNIIQIMTPSYHPAASIDVCYNQTLIHTL